MVDKILFKNYKSFKDQQNLELKPITILIGKNSSGKSAVAKLPVLIDNSFNNVIGEPFTIDYNNVQFGGEYRDIFYERLPNGILEFKIVSESGHSLEVAIISDFEKNTIPKIIGWKLEGYVELIYTRTANIYINKLDEKTYKCEFNGFEIETIIPVYGEPEDLFIPTSFVNIKTDYIGPFRVYANDIRSFKLSSFRDIKKVGVNGEDAYHILGIESLKNHSELLKNVSNWYINNFEGWAIKVNTDISPFCQIELVREDKNFSVNIADAGQGMSQALPLVVNAFLASNNILTIIEQPELHLHPAAHGSIAELFANAAKRFNKKYLIETHSQNFILRIRRLIAEKRLEPTDVCLYWVDYDGETNSSQLKRIHINELGEVDFWPENIFSESLDEVIAIRKAQENNSNAN